MGSFNIRGLQSDLLPGEKRESGKQGSDLKILSIIQLAREKYKLRLRILPPTPSFPPYLSQPWYLIVLEEYEFIRKYSRNPGWVAWLIKALSQYTKVASMIPGQDTYKNQQVNA